MSDAEGRKPVLTPEVKNLIDVLAETKVTAHAAATTMLQTAFLQLLLEKGLITRDEIEATLAKVEKFAVASKGTRPLVSEQLLLTSMELRHAFDAGPKRAS